MPSQSSHLGQALITALSSLAAAPSGMVLMDHLFSQGLVSWDTVIEGKDEATSNQTVRQAFLNHLKSSIKNSNTFPDWFFEPSTLASFMKEPLSLFEGDNRWVWPFLREIPPSLITEKSSKIDAWVSTLLRKKSLLSPLESSSKETHNEFVTLLSCGLKKSISFVGKRYPSLWSECTTQIPTPAKHRDCWENKPFVFPHGAPLLIASTWVGAWGKALSQGCNPWEEKYGMPLWKRILEKVSSLEDLYDPRTLGGHIKNWVNQQIVCETLTEAQRDSLILYSAQSLYDTLSNGVHYNPSIRRHYWSFLAKMPGEVFDSKDFPYLGIHLLFNHRDTLPEWAGLFAKKEVHNPALRYVLRIIMPSLAEMTPFLVDRLGWTKDPLSEEERATFMLPETQKLLDQAERELSKKPKMKALFDIFPSRRQAIALEASLMDMPVQASRPPSRRM